MVHLETAKGSSVLHYDNFIGLPVSVSSGVHWRASSGLPADHSHTTAAAGPVGCAGSQAAAVRRLTRHRGTTKHHCGPGKDRSTLLCERHLNLCVSIDKTVFVTYTTKVIKAYN